MLLRLCCLSLWFVLFALSFAGSFRVLGGVSLAMLFHILFQSMEPEVLMLLLSSTGVIGGTKSSQESSAGVKFDEVGTDFSADCRSLEVLGAVLIKVDDADDDTEVEALGTTEANVVYSWSGAGFSLK